MDKREFERIVLENQKEARERAYWKVNYKRRDRWDAAEDVLAVAYKATWERFAAEPEADPSRVVSYLFGCINKAALKINDRASEHTILRTLHRSTITTNLHPDTKYSAPLFDIFALLGRFLTKEQKEVIDMRIRRDLSYSMMAACLHTTPGAAKNRYLRACRELLAAIRALLDPDGPDGPGGGARDEAFRAAFRRRRDETMASVLRTIERLVEGELTRMVWSPATRASDGRDEEAGPEELVHMSSDRGNRIERDELMTALRLYGRFCRDRGVTMFDHAVADADWEDDRDGGADGGGEGPGWGSRSGRNGGGSSEVPVAASSFAKTAGSRCGGWGGVRIVQIRGAGMDDLPIVPDPNTPRRLGRGSTLRAVRRRCGRGPIVSATGGGMNAMGRQFYLRPRLRSVRGREAFRKT